MFRPHHIDARRWFDGTSTYHQVVIYGTTGHGTPTEVDSGLTYGYGDQWRVTAEEMLDISERERFYTYCRDKGITYRVTDVKRKKDL